MPANHYKVLGVSRRATAAEITEAYRVRASEWHPDRHVGSPKPVQEAAEARFKEANEAHQVLSDPIRRRDYDAETLFGTFCDDNDDAEQQRRRAAAGAASFDEIFTTAMATLFTHPPPPPRAAPPPPPLSSTAPAAAAEVAAITLEDAAVGGTIRLRSGLEIDFPPGVLDGTIYRVRLRNGRAISYTVSIQPHPVFRHEPGSVDLAYDAVISLSDALTATASGSVTDLRGRAHAWVQEAPRRVAAPGARLATIVGAGLPVRDAPGARGNIVVYAKVATGWPERPLSHQDLERAGLHPPRG
jgi:DnaJ-class molecular chaperone